MSKLSFETASYHFSIKVWQLLLSLLLIAGLCGLGFWQIQRGQQKAVWLSTLKARSQGEAKRLDDISNALDFQRVRLQGRVDDQHQLLLDNKYHQHQLGFQVLTPIKLPGEARWVLVNRGWVARGQTRQDLPKLAPLQAEQNWTGIVYYPKKSLLLLSQREERQKSWPKIMQRIDFKAFERTLNRPVMPFIFILDADQPATLVRDWKPVIMPPARHYAYAFQWFALALTLLVIVIAVNLRKRQKLL